MTRQRSRITYGDILGRAFIASMRILVATAQRRAAHRMGENDAWQAAIAEQMGAVLVGHDEAFKRLGTAYEDHRRA
jgi:hypothetical protein